MTIKPVELAELISLIDSGTISNKIAKDILPELLAQGGSPKALIERKGLIQISDTGAIEAAIGEVIAAHPKELEMYRNGRTKMLGFFVGQVMKQTGGRADPKLTNQLLAKQLNA